MPWVILRFVLIGPIVGCVVFTFLDHLGAAQRVNAGSPAMAVGETFLESAVAGVYGVIFTYPLTGSMAAIAGFC